MHNRGGDIEEIGRISFYRNKKIQGVYLTSSGNYTPYATTSLDILKKYTENDEELRFRAFNDKTKNSVDYSFNKERKFLKFWFNTYPTLKEEIGYECVEYEITEENRV